MRLFADGRFCGSAEPVQQEWFPYSGSHVDRVYTPVPDVVVAPEIDAVQGGRVTGARKDSTTAADQSVPTDRPQTVPLLLDDALAVMDVAHILSCPTPAWFSCRCPFHSVRCGPPRSVDTVSQSAVYDSGGGDGQSHGGVTAQLRRVGGYTPCYGCSPPTIQRRASSTTVAAPELLELIEFQRQFRCSTSSTVECTVQSQSVQLSPVQIQDMIAQRYLIRGSLRRPWIHEYGMVPSTCTSADEVYIYDDAEHYMPRKVRRPPTAQSPVYPAGVVQGPMQPLAQCRCPHRGTDIQGPVESTVDDEIMPVPRYFSPAVDNFVERGLVPSTWSGDRPQNKPVFGELIFLETGQVVSVADVRPEENEDRVLEAPREFEVGASSAMDELCEINLGTNQIPPIFIVLCYPNQRLKTTCIEIDPSMIKAIVDLKPPRSLTQLRSFQDRQALVPRTCLLPIRPYTVCSVEKGQIGRSLLWVLKRGDGLPTSLSLTAPRTSASGGCRGDFHSLSRRCEYGQADIESFSIHRFDLADIRLFGKLFIRCCEYGQVDIELFSFAVANMVRRMLNSLSLSPFVSLFRSGQANIGLSSFTVSIWSGECWTFFLLSHRCDYGQVDIRLSGGLIIRCCEYGQANVDSPFWLGARQSPWEAYFTTSSFPLFYFPVWGVEFSADSLFTVSIWSGEHRLLPQFTGSIWSGECGIFLFPSALLFRSGQADVGCSFFFLFFSPFTVSIWSVNVGFSFSLPLCCFDLVRQTVGSLFSTHVHCFDLVRQTVGSLFLLMFTVSIWSGEHSASSPFTVSIWSGECGIFLFPSVLLFRSGQADGWFFLRSCSLFRSGQVSIRLLPHSLFRSGQVNVGFSFSLPLCCFDLVRQTVGSLFLLMFTVSIWSGEH
ncbi:hypothetical protein KFK09_007644 [Dendrobium nobile]|uniref:Uncharacterized protein n=1 Tax=Dendrobium nobile TaxID=94219 RepID=A0A8T3BXG0_DENNO|nr:hypothetical protein KFK09_007644 [Dendrobium nobile]